MRLILRILLAAAAAGTLAPTDLWAQPGSLEEMEALFPDEIRRLDLSWEHSFAAPLADASHFAAFNLHLIVGLQPEEEALALHRLRMGADGFRGEEEPVDTEGLPEDFQLEAMTPNAYTQALVLAGQTAEGPAVYVARLDAEASPSGPWEPLASLPEGFNGHFFKGHSYDGHLFLFSRLPRGDRPELAAHTINLALPEEMRSWTTMPPPPEVRRGDSVVMLRNRVYQVGGQVLPEEGGAARPGYVPYRTGFESPDFTEWERIFRPVPLEYSDTLGIGYGSAIFLAQREPWAPETSGEEEEAQPEPPSVMQLQLATDYGGGELGHWRPLVLEQPPAEIRDMVVDPGYGRLLLFTEPDDDSDAEEERSELRLSAYSLPSWMPSRRPSDEELQRAHYAQHAVEPARLPVDTLLSGMAEENAHGVIILPGSDEDTSLDLRLRMGSTRHRYMMMGSMTTFLEGTQGEEARQRYNVGATPAYIILDPEGNEVGRHEGGIPSNEELFRLTSPLRSATME